MPDEPRISNHLLRGSVPLRYITSGDAGGDPVLLLHGLADSSFSFSRLLPHLPRSWFAIAPDLRGHGDSGRPAEGYEIDTYAADARDLLEALGVQQAMVVGHSFGSFVAQRVAALYPAKVRKLALLGSFATPGQPEVRQLAEAIQALRDPVDADFVREFQMGTVHRSVPPEFLDRVVQESLKLPAGVWKAVISGLLRGSAGGTLERIAVPTLIIWGERDAYFPRAEQEELLRRIAGSVLRVLPDVGHAPHWEVPEECARLLTAFGAASGARRNGVEP